MGHLEYCIELRTKKPMLVASVVSRRTPLSPEERLKYESLIDMWARQIALLEKDIQRLETLLKKRNGLKGSFKIGDAKISNRQLTSDRIREYKKFKNELETKMSTAITILRIHA
jgi:hypothetical protein